MQCFSGSVGSCICPILVVNCVAISQLICHLDHTHASPLLNRGYVVMVFLYCTLLHFILHKYIPLASIMCSPAVLYDVPSLLEGYFIMALLLWGFCS